MSCSCLLVSVGGAPGPVVFTIERHRPEKIIFFVSRASRSSVTQKILPEVMGGEGFPPPDHEFVVTPDEQDVGECVFALMKGVPQALAKMGLPDSPWAQCVDYTGGTKSMSAAMIWASSRFPCQMSYVGTPAPEGREKGGMGTVIDGKERCFLQENPWNRIAYVEARSAAELFNRGQYGNAAGIIGDLSKRVTDDKALRLFRPLAEVFQGFHAWDIFQHKRAQKLLFKNLTPLLSMADSDQIIFPGLKSFARDVDRLLRILNGIKPDCSSREIIHDLLANAMRRAELEQKYDDATARCYSTIEKAAHHELLYRFGIDASDARPEKIPDLLREEYMRRYTTTRPASGKQSASRIQFGLDAAMKLLQHFGDPMGLRYAERKDQIKSHLAERNNSILAHGVQPMEQEKFRALFDDALLLLGIEQSDLTRFPSL